MTSVVLPSNSYSLSSAFYILLPELTALVIVFFFSSKFSICFFFMFSCSLLTLPVSLLKLSVFSSVSVWLLVETFFIRANFFFPHTWYKHSMHVGSVSLVWLFCSPMDYSLPGSSVHGISQARTLEWIAISSPRGSSWHRDQTRKPVSLASPVLAGGVFITEPLGKPISIQCIHAIFALDHQLSFRVNENKKTLILFYLPLFHIQGFSFLCVNASFWLIVTLLPKKHSLILVLPTVLEIPRGHFMQRWAQ